MRTDSQSPSHCIICKPINFPNRYRLAGGRDKVLSLHTSQDTLSQWGLFNSGRLPGLSLSPPPPPFLSPSTPLNRGARKKKLDLGSGLLLQLAGILLFWFLP